MARLVYPNKLSVHERENIRISASYSAAILQSSDQRSVSRQTLYHLDLFFSRDKKKQLSNRSQ